MTHTLCNFLTAGADKVAVTDPHGWTLTIVSILVVFTALLVLYAVYGLIGEISKKSIRRGKEIDAETTAAIAMALQLARLENEAEEESSVMMHDSEPGFITISKDVSRWGDRSLTFRKNISK